MWDKWNQQRLDLNQKVCWNEFRQYLYFKYGKFSISKTRIIQNDFYYVVNVVHTHFSFFYYIANNIGFYLTDGDDSARSENNFDQVFQNLHEKEKRRASEEFHEIQKLVKVINDE